MSTLTLDQFRNAFQTGGLLSVAIAAAGSVFFITAEPRQGERVTLATTRGKQPRGFQDPAKAIALLHGLGASKFEVDISNWSPRPAASEARLRPDTAERQRQAHAAAAHDAWFRAEVEQALREADDPETEWVSQEEVAAQSAAHRARWRAAM